MIYRLERKGGDGTYFLPPNHAESWIYWEAAFVRVLCNIVDQLVVPSKVKTQLRPHPFEMAHCYRSLQESSGGLLDVVKQGTMSEWLKGIGTLVTVLSASALDASVRNVPVISIKGLMPKSAADQIPPGYHYDYYDFFWQANGMDELKELVNNGLAGKLAVSPKLDQLAKYIADHFVYPRIKPSAQLVAEQIAEFLGNHPARSFKPMAYRRKAAGSVLSVAENIPFSCEALMFGYWLNDIRQGNRAGGGPRITYLPWRKDLINKAESLAEQIHLAGR